LAAHFLFLSNNSSGVIFVISDSPISKNLYPKRSFG